MDVKMEALKLLKQLFTKTNFADAKLKDGTIVSAEAFEPGQDLFIVDESGQRIVAPEGPHTLEDGSEVVVKDGKIETITKVELGEIEEEVDEIEEEMAIEVEIEPMVDEVPEKEKEIALLKTMCEEMMGKIKMMEEEMSKMKMSSDETNQTIVEAVVELSDNFSKLPAGDKLDINPTDLESKFSKISKVGKKQSIQEWLVSNKK